MTYLIEYIMKKCPICSKEQDVKFKPFCSPRCEKVDLNRWLSEVYTIPVEENEYPPDLDEEFAREQR